MDRLWRWVNVRGPITPANINQRRMSFVLSVPGQKSDFFYVSRIRQSNFIVQPRLINAIAMHMPYFSFGRIKHLRMSCLHSHSHTQLPVLAHSALPPIA